MLVEIISAIGSLTTTALGILAYKKPTKNNNDFPLLNTTNELVFPPRLLAQAQNLYDRAWKYSVVNYYCPSGYKDLQWVMSKRNDCFQIGAINVCGFETKHTYNSPQNIYNSVIDRGVKFVDAVLNYLGENIFWQELTSEQRYYIIMIVFNDTTILARENESISLANRPIISFSDITWLFNSIYKGDLSLPPKVGDNNLKLDQFNKGVKDLKRIILDYATGSYTQWNAQYNLGCI